MQQQDGLPHKPPRHEGCLFRPNALRQRRPPPVGKALGEEAVVCVQQGDRPVVGNVGLASRLVEGGHQAISEPRRSAPCVTNSSEKGGKEGGDEIAAAGPKLRGDPIRAWGFAPLGALKGKAHLICCHLGGTRGCGCGGAKGGAVCGHCFKHGLAASGIAKGGLGDVGKVGSSYGGHGTTFGAQVAPRIGKGWD